MLYTGSADEDLLFSGLDSGARGYALKDGSPRELSARSRSVAEGGTYVDPRLRPALLSRRSTERLPSLSNREREILDLLAQGSPASRWPTSSCSRPRPSRRTSATRWQARGAHPRARDRDRAARGLHLPARRREVGAGA